MKMCNRRKEETDEGKESRDQEQQVKQQKVYDTRQMDNKYRTGEQHIREANAEDILRL